MKRSTATALRHVPSLTARTTHHKRHAITRYVNTDGVVTYLVYDVKGLHVIKRTRKLADARRFIDNGS